MGNHEFCSRCHASDFHLGMSCEEAYPEKLKRADKQRADHEKRRLKIRGLCQTLVEMLRGMNVPAEMEEHQMQNSDDWSLAKVVINGHNLDGRRREAMRSTDPKVRARRAKKYEDLY
jgi:hypothetical protein